MDSGLVLSEAGQVCNTEGGQVRFGTPSDNIFANLFLDVNSPTGCVPLEFCEKILAAVRNPSFIALEVTFADCGDMLSQVAIRKHEAWSEKVRRPDSQPRMPTVVLEGVFDIFKDEMLYELYMRRRYPMGNVFFFDRTACKFPSSGFQAWAKTILNASLVHSSWYAHARRLQGYTLSSQKSALALSKYNQSSMFSAWTRELHLDFTGQSTTFQLREDYFNVSFEHFQLTALCSRLTGVRIATIGLPVDISAVRSLSAEFFCHLREAVVSLRALEDVRFIVLAIPDVLLRTLVETQHASLRSVCFEIQSAQDGLASYSHTLPQPLVPLEALPLLNLIRVICNFNHRTLSLQALGWRRNLSIKNAEFLGDSAVAIWTNVAPHPVGTDLEVLGLARCVELRFGVAEMAPTDDYMKELGNIFSSTFEASPISRLILTYVPWMAMGMTVWWPRSVEELVITYVIPHEVLVAVFENAVALASEHDFTFADARLAEPIRSGSVPQLRVLKLVLESEDLDDKLWTKKAIKEYAHGKQLLEVPDFTGSYACLFPECKRICSERRVEFTVEVMFEGSGGRDWFTQSYSQ